jgi:uncharacterized protein YdaU (DUF1376 family)
MIKFIAFYPHEFHNDPRVIQLETKEQQLFLFLLTKMMQTQASIPENYNAIGRTLAISSSSAQKLIAKLKRLELLIASETGEKIFTLTSRRLTTEYIKAKTGCQTASKKAQDAANARWEKERALREANESMLQA